jgi:hypothetical protein
MARYDRSTLEAFDSELKARGQELAAQDPLELTGLDAQDLVAAALGDNDDRLDWEPATDGVSMQLNYEGAPVPVTLSPDNHLYAAGHQIGIVEETDGQIISAATEEPLSAAEICEQVRSSIEHELARPGLESSPELEIQDEAYLEQDDPEIDDDHEMGYQSPSLTLHETEAW